jgi:hypothetical protein
MSMTRQPLDVSCPTCSAMPGKPCRMSDKGRRFATHHVARVRRADRENEERPNDEGTKRLSRSEDYRRDAFERRMALPVAVQCPHVDEAKERCQTWSSPRYAAGRTNGLCSFHSMTPEERKAKRESRKAAEESA